MLLAENEIIPGHDEVFYELHGSWLKLNTSVQPLAPAVTGFAGCTSSIPACRRPAGRLHDADGLPITLVPPGYRGVEEIGLPMTVLDVEAQARFLVEGCGAERVGHDGYRVGNTVIFLTAVDGPMEITPIVRNGFSQC